MTTATEFRAEAAAHAAEAAASFERCDTDGFVSQWSSGLAASAASLNAAIVERGGWSEFPALFNLTGEFVPAKRIEGTYGPRWLVLDADGKSTGVFLTYFPKRRATLADKGYTEGWVKRPSKADYWAPPGARGLAGATSVRVMSVPTDRPWDPPLEVVTVDRFEGAAKIAPRGGTR